MDATSVDVLAGQGACIARALPRVAARWVLRVPISTMPGAKKTTQRHMQHQNSFASVRVCWCNSASAEALSGAEALEH